MAKNGVTRNTGLPCRDLSIAEEAIIVARMYRPDSRN
jgi:hypothetical protein